VSVYSRAGTAVENFFFSLISGYDRQVQRERGFTMCGMVR
jgi:hypothetical protein